MLVSDEPSQYDRPGGLPRRSHLPFERQSSRSTMLVVSRHPTTRTSYRDENVGVDEKCKAAPVLARHALRKSLLLCTLSC
jgi:hypothetical protein